MTSSKFTLPIVFCSKERTILWHKKRSCVILLFKMSFYCVKLRKQLLRFNGNRQNNSCRKTYFIKERFQRITLSGVKLFNKMMAIFFKIAILVFIFVCFCERIIYSNSNIARYRMSWVYVGIHRKMYYVK